MRSDGRANNELRPVTITPDFLENPLASVLIEFGKTKVICSASLDETVPRWMKDAGHGWVTAEYAMLPSSGHERSQRESMRGKVGGRTYEIQRLVGRSLRSVVDLKALGERTLWIDCDVIQADGGTRTASITGGFIALQLAVNRLIDRRVIVKNPIRERMAAISVGIVKKELLLDLAYEEDSAAEVDMNIVMTESGRLIEIQGTAETEPFSRQMCNDMIDLAYEGVIQLITCANETLHAS